MIARHLFGRALAAGVSLAALTSCSSPRHEVEEKYYLIANNTKVEYWKTAAAGLERAGERMGVKTQLAGPETHDVKAQHEEFQKVIQNKPTGILVSASDAKLLQPDIDAAIAQGIPVITIDSDAVGSKRLLFIGTDNYQAGTIGGNIVAKQLNGKGNVAVFTIPEQPNLRERLHGYQDVFAAHPGIKITRTIDTKGEASAAFDAAKDIADKGAKDVDAFVCLEAIACPEVADVLNRGNLHKLVVAMDVDPRTLDWIKKGVITATIGQKPFTMAYYGVKMLDDVHHSKLPTLDKKWGEDSFSPLPSFVDTGATLIDKNNVDEFQKAFQSETTKK